jgi:leader peptidase (prepilin peptidase) / N-methyltransferase
MQYCQLHLPFCDGTVAHVQFLKKSPAGIFFRKKKAAEHPGSFVEKNNFFAFASYDWRPSSLSTSRSSFEPRMFADAEHLWVLGVFVALCLLCGLLSLIDIQRGIIPDKLNLSIAVLGIIKAILGNGPQDAIAALGQAAAIGVIFWLLRRLYFFWRRVQGLGLGDVKFLAAAGTWIGIAGLPILLLIATSGALVAVGGMRLARRDVTKQTSLPFGPFLASGLVLTALLQQLLGL